MLGLSIILMAAFGLPANLSPRQSPAATINGTDISFKIFAQKLRSVESYYRTNLGQNYDSFKDKLNLPNQTMNGIINDTLMSNYYDELGFVASINAQKGKMTSLPWFSENLTKEKFQNFLLQSGITEEQFKISLSHQIIQEMFDSMLKDIAEPSNAEIKAIYTRDNAKRKIAWIELDKTTLEEDVEISEKEVSEWYNENKKKYKKSPSVAYRAIAFDAKNYRGSVEYEREDIKLFYLENKHDFKTPKQYKLKKIKIFKIDDKKDPLADMISGDETSDENNFPMSKSTPKQRIEFALERIKGGENFSKVASEVSEDEKTAQKEGLIGWKNVNHISSKIKGSLAGLKAGQHSEIMETDSAYEIYLLEDIREPGVQPFESIEKQLEYRYKVQESPIYAEADAEDAKLSIEDGETSLNKLAEQKKLEIISTQKPVHKGNAPKGIPVKITLKALNYSSGDIFIFAEKTRVWLVEIKELIPEFILEQKDVKDRIEKELKEKKKEELIQTKAKDLIATARQSGTLDNISKEFNAKIQHSEPFTRLDQLKGTLSSIRGLQKATFETKVKEIIDSVFKHPKKIIIAQVTEKFPPDFNNFEKEKENILEKEQSNASIRIHRALIENLKSNADIEINDSVISQL